ncbi:HAD hydrolase-like protein [Patescibacteria group bacterium]|nr:HAD hydrolase-like protein [Patescibacteria group bacterium]
MKIVLDFDHTLFDTEKFKQALQGRLAMFGVTVDQFNSNYRIVKEQLGHYDYQEHLRLLAQEEELDENDLLLNFNEIVNSANEFLFPDVLNFLESLKAISKSELYLLTFGQDKFQQAKVEASGIRPYFKEVVDTVDSKLIFFDQNKKLQKATFVDNRGKTIDQIKMKYPDVVAIWLKRENTPYDNENCKRMDFQVDSLTEVLQYINK